MARKLRLKVVAICQDDGGKRGGVAACYNFAGPGGHVLINAQIGGPLSGANRHFETYRF